METNAVADPDLQIRGEGHGHPDPRPCDKRGDSVSNKMFSALWAPVWSKNKEGLGPLGPSPGSATIMCWWVSLVKPAT